MTFNVLAKSSHQPLFINFHIQTHHHSYGYIRKYEVMSDILISKVFNKIHSITWCADAHWHLIFSSPEPLGSLVSLWYSHGPSSVRPFVVRRPPFSKIFFSKTAGQIKTKFHMEPQWDGGTKVCSRGLDHVTKMAATPIYGKHPSKIFCRTKGPMTLWLGM